MRRAGRRCVAAVLAMTAAMCAGAQTSAAKKKHAAATASKAHATQSTGHTTAHTAGHSTTHTAHPAGQGAARSGGKRTAGHVAAGRVAAGHGAKGRTARGAASARGGAGGKRVAMVAPTAESRRLTSAFVASAQLRPMAQQLALTRAPAAYAGVSTYAASHPGEAASAAALALGHAYMLDRRYTEAEAEFRQASKAGDALADYADFLAAQAAVQAGHAADALPLLDHFAEKHPGSLFVPSVPILQANALMATGNAGGAVAVLQPLANTPAASHVDFRAMLARAYAASGNTAQAAQLYRGIYLNDPLSSEANNARAQLSTLNAPLTPAERKQHADAMFNAKQYTEAEQEYRALQKDEGSLTQADRDALEIYAAVCDLRLKKLTRGDVAHLPVTGDDTAALKLYLQSELDRNEGLTSEHDEIIQQLESSYPKSRWTEEALYSSGNMYLVKGDMPRAIEFYTRLFLLFPRSTYAPNAHWHAAWLSYRLRKFPDAARLMDEQIANYPASSEIPGALYWRGRMYEDVEHNFGQAENYYRKLSDAYVDTYHAMLGRERLSVLGKQAEVAPAAVLATVRTVEDPHLTAELPENDPHLIKARLLANAALNEYIRPELQLSETAGEWSALAEAEIYESFGESSRALQAMKRSRIPFNSLPVSAVPMEYWQIVYPRPYWSTLVADAQANGLDPYLVAALIRQESEFNPNAVSRANAYGLMQLLPSVGKGLAKKAGDKHFNAAQLLQPSLNLQLGTMDLRHALDRYNGQVEYALASYNAGDTPVHRWIAENDYKDVPEWVESIPYTETREYVEAIIRNREMYRALYGGKP